MNRREALWTTVTAAAAASVLRPHRIAAQGDDAYRTSPNAETVYLHPALGADTNAGTRERPLRTLAAAARRVNESRGDGPMTIVLAEGVYAVGETARFEPQGRAFSRTKRLTIRAELLPDDAEWHTDRMPTLIHTLPLSPLWFGQPDPFGGVAYGMEIETSHVTIQGLKILGAPVVEHPRPGVVRRVYPIGRMGRELDDLLITQCLFAGDEVTNPNHLAILAHGKGLVIEHCVFHGVKVTAVYWTPGSTGHAMRNSLVYGAYGCGLWTVGIANDFEYRNNVVAHSNYVWIGEPAAPAGGSAPKAQRAPAHYKVIDSLFAGNKKLAGSGAGPLLNFQDLDPSFLELVGTVVSDEAVTLELDQTQRRYLHPVAGSAAARVGAGLFNRT